MIFKIETKKVLFVEADSKKEADEMAFDGDEIFSDEFVVKVTKSSRKEMSQFAFNPFGESEDTE
jgi:hypothetical protein